MSRAFNAVWPLVVCVFLIGCVDTSNDLDPNMSVIAVDDDPTPAELYPDFEQTFSNAENFNCCGSACCRSVNGVTAYCTGLKDPNNACMECTNTNAGNTPPGVPVQNGTSCAAGGTCMDGSCVGGIDAAPLPDAPAGAVDAAPSVDAATGNGDDGGGCAAASDSGAPSVILLLGMFAALGLRRRRRRD